MSQFVRVGDADERLIRSISVDKAITIVLHSMRLRGELLSRKAIMDSLKNPAAVTAQGLKGISVESEADLQKAASMILAADLLEQELKEDHFISHL